MLKEYKNPDELIDILKERKVVFTGNEKVMKDYLKKYTYNSVVNPYKVIYCAKIAKTGEHIYEKYVDSSEIIAFFDRSMEFNTILFSCINKFEYNFSAILTKMYTKHFVEIKSEILKDACDKYNLEVDNINKKLRNEIKIKLEKIGMKKTTTYKYSLYLEEYGNRIEKQLFNKTDVFTVINDLKKLNKKHSNYELNPKTKAKYIGLSDINNIKAVFSEEENHIRYSYFHGSKNKISFGDKITLFKLLPTKHQNKVLKELRNLRFNGKGKYKISRDVDKFLFELNNLKGIRNQVYHINSINYFQYKDTRNEFYKYQYDALINGKSISKVKDNFKFENTKISRLIAFLKIREKHAIERHETDLKDIYENTLEKYYLKNMIEVVEIEDVTKLLTDQGYSAIIRL